MARFVEIEGRWINPRLVEKIEPAAGADAKACRLYMTATQTPVHVGLPASEVAALLSAEPPAPEPEKSPVDWGGILEVCAFWLEGHGLEDANRSDVLAIHHHAICRGGRDG